MIGSWCAMRFRKVRIGASGPEPQSLPVRMAADAVQGGPPQRFVILAKHGGPETEGQRRDDAAGRRLLSLLPDLLDGLGKLAGLPFAQKKTLVATPVLVPGLRHHGMDAVAKRHLQHLQGRVEAFGNPGVEGVKLDSPRPVAR